MRLSNPQVLRLSKMARLLKSLLHIFLATSSRPGNSTTAKVDLVEVVGPRLLASGFCIGLLLRSLLLWVSFPAPSWRFPSSSLHSQPLVEGRTRSGTSPSRL